MPYLNFLTISRDPHVEAQRLATDLKLGGRVHIQPLQKETARIIISLSGIEDRADEIRERGEELGLGLENVMDA